MGLEALKHGFLTAMASSIFAGWLIALMVWMLPASLGNQVSVISIMTCLIGIGGFVLVTWLNHAQVASGDGHRK